MTRFSVMRILTATKYCSVHPYKLDILLYLLLAVEMQEQPLCRQAAAMLICFLHELGRSAL